MPTIGSLLGSTSSPPFSPQNEETLLTRPETAQYLRISVPTLERWAKLGIGPRLIRIGGSVRYPLSGVRRYAQTGDQAA
jgi:predicted DNA-binding transcriptional regulator AlpA